MVEEIKMVREYRTDSPVKSACVMVDEAHVCTGSFDGSVSMWDIKVDAPLFSLYLIFYTFLYLLFLFIFAL